MHFNTTLVENKEVNVVAADQPSSAAEQSIVNVEQRPITVSFFSNAKDKYPKPWTGTLGDLVVKLTKHREKEIKDGPAFVPAIFQAGTTRKAENVVEMTALVLDIDDGTPYAVMQPLLEPFFHVYHTSHSHSPEKHKYRVVVPLEQPIARDDWAAFWQRAANYFGHMDQATKDCPRLYYLPSHRSGAEFDSAFHPGKLLSSSDLPELIDQEKQSFAARKETPFHIIPRPVDQGDVLVIKSTNELHPEAGLHAVVQRCQFMQYASAAEHQAELSEPLWMAMISNACRFENSDAWTHVASEHHDGYSELETQNKIDRCRETYSPFSCVKIRELGFTGCPEGGCKTPKDKVTNAPAGLVGWIYKQAAPELPLNQDVTELESYQVNAFTISNAGIWHSKPDRDGVIRTTQISASRIDVIGHGKSPSGDDWVHVLSFLDLDNVRKTWLMPSAYLGTNNHPYREILLSKGAALYTGINETMLLASYLSTAQSHNRVTVVEQLGWHGNNFVLPDACYGQSLTEEVIFQGVGTGGALRFQQGGTFDNWKASVAGPAQGNSRLMLAICVALSGCVVPLLKSENLGFNLCGPSSIGKSLALKIAASVWGDKDFVQTWNATSNGLLATAALHNHTFLALDEMGEAPSSAIGGVIYALGNGIGRTRADRTGQQREAKRWQLSFLSTSERSASVFMGEHGEQVKAGQEVRLIEIPADAGHTLGIFDCLNGAENSRALATALEAAFSANYGHTGRMWVGLLADPHQQRDLLARIEVLAFQFCSGVIRAGDAGQVGRVAARFALLAGVGEVCCEKDILPWSAGSVTQAMQQCFKAWLEQRGGRGELENDQAIAAVREFIVRNGSSRFEEKSFHGIDSLQPRIPNRAGYTKANKFGETIYYIQTDVYKTEVCSGLEVKQVTKALKDKGYLQNASLQRVPGEQDKRQYYYPIHEKILGQLLDVDKVVVTDTEKDVSGESLSHPYLV